MRSSRGSHRSARTGAPERLSEFVETLAGHLGGEWMQPQPVQRRIPLTIGAHSDTALRLAARYADRWSSYGGIGLEPAVALDRARVRNGRLDDLCREAGREPGSLQRSLLLGYPYVRETPWRSEDGFRDVVARWQAAGFDELVLYYPPTVGMPEGSVEKGLFERMLGEAAAVTRRT